MADLSDFLKLQSREDLEKMIERMVLNQTPIESQSLSNSRFDLGNGISLYKQKQSSKWYCRIHQPDNSIFDYRQSTRTSDVDEAKAMAFKIAFTLGKVRISGEILLG
ncbi:hypothetical protein ACK3ZB_09410 [Aeromonas caviae]